MALTRNKRLFGSAEVWSLFRDAGYLKPTRLQSRLVPLLLRGKDVALEAERDSGKTAAFVLPLLLRMKKSKAGTKAVILASTIEDTRKIEREFRRFSDSNREAAFAAVAALGGEPTDRKEHRLLAQDPQVVIGTPARVIDHIRRGNLNLAGVQVAVVDRTQSPEKPGFEEDVLFIFSKLPQRRQTILITSSLETDSGQLLGLLRRPVTLPASIWRQQADQRREYYSLVPLQERFDALIALVLAGPAESLLIQCPDAQCVREVLRRIHALRLSALALQEDMKGEQQEKVCQTFSVGKVPILVSTFQAASGRSLRWVTHVVNLGLPPNAESYAPRSFTLVQVLSLVGEESLRQKETLLTNAEKKQLPSEAEVLQGTIQHIMRRIRDEEDPQTLNHYRAVVRRNVPLAQRSYFTAYLFKESFVPERPKGAEFSKLFINIGRNRRLFPRDLIDLVMSRLQASRSQIRGIKILDNYSFIEIDSALAERAVRELSGAQLKGRSVAVNYARKREDR